MAIKLETKSIAPSAVATLEIRSFDGASSVVLYTEELREPVSVNGKDEWQVSKLNKQQFCSFIGADGAPCSLEGKVLEAECVEIAAAYKIVVQIKVSNELKGAYAAGKVSKGYMALELVRVVEVWDSPKNCLWKAKEAAAGATGRTFDPASGKIS